MATDLEARLQAFLEKAKARGKEKAAQRVIRDAESIVALSQELFPRPNSPYGVYPYSHEDGANTMFSWHLSANENAVVTNSADYYRYANKGFTTKGEGTARSYGSGVPYNRRVIAEWKVRNSK
jgi:hypothetical protein